MNLKILYENGVRQISILSTSKGRNSYDLPDRWEVKITFDVGRNVYHGMSEIRLVFFNLLDVAELIKLLEAGFFNAG